MVTGNVMFNYGKKCFDSLQLQKTLHPNGACIIKFVKVNNEEFSLHIVILNKYNWKEFHQVDNQP